MAMFTLLTNAKKSVVLGIALMSIIFVIGSIYVSDNSSSSLSKNLLEKYGKPDTAIQKNDTQLFTDEYALFSYVSKFGPKQTMQQLHDLQQAHGDCHNVGHETGRIAYELFGDKAFQECTAECHSGCYHGATEAFFQENGTANLVDNLDLLCDQDLNSFFNHQCLHGIGHGLMAWTNYDLFEALQSCDFLPEGQSSCYSGVFMENVVGGLAKEASAEEQKNFAGHFTEYLSDDPHYPCNIVGEQYKWGCYIFQTSRMLQILNYDFAKVAIACVDTPEKHLRTCFESLGRDIGGTHRGNPTKMIEACQSSPQGSMRTGCLMGAVQDSFWDPAGQDTALEFCKLLTDKQEKDECYNIIFWRAPDVLASQTELKTFCEKSENAYQGQCFTQMQP
jgi:hypothetical protein